MIWHHFSESPIQLVATIFHSGSVLKDRFVDFVGRAAEIAIKPVPNLHDGQDSVPALEYMLPTAHVRVGQPRERLQIIWVDCHQDRP